MSVPGGMDPDGIGLEAALKLLALPRVVGAHPESGQWQRRRQRRRPSPARRRISGGGGREFWDGTVTVAPIQDDYGFQSGVEGVLPGRAFSIGSSGYTIDALTGLRGGRYIREDEYLSERVVHRGPAKALNSPVLRGDLRKPQPRSRACRMGCGLGPNCWTVGAAFGASGAGDVPVRTRRRRGRDEVTVPRSRGGPHCWRQKPTAEKGDRLVARTDLTYWPDASTAYRNSYRRCREFPKMIAQGGHVTPCIESNPLTACTRIGLPRFWEAAERRNKYNIYSKIQSLKQPSYKVEMHKCVGGREFAHLSGRRAHGCAATVAEGGSVLTGRLPVMTQALPST